MVNGGSSFFESGLLVYGQFGSFCSWDEGKSYDFATFDYWERENGNASAPQLFDEK